MTQATLEPLVLLVERREIKEKPEKRAKEANQEKTVIPDLQASPESKETQVFQVPQAETEREV